MHVPCVRTTCLQMNNLMAAANPALAIFMSAKASTNAARATKLSGDATKMLDDATKAAKAAVEQGKVLGKKVADMSAEELIGKGVQGFVYKSLKKDAARYASKQALWNNARYATLAGASATRVGVRGGMLRDSLKEKPTNGVGYRAFSFSDPLAVQDCSTEVINLGVK